MADRHNACINPCLTNDNTGWGGNGTAPVRTAVSGFGRPNAARYVDGSFIRTQYGAATAGLDYTVSLYIRYATFNVNGSIYIEWQDASHGALSYTSTGYSATAGVVTRISVSGTAPANTAFIAIIVDGETFSANTVDATMVLIEQAASLGSYFDGDTANGSWNGAAGNSASTLASGSAVSGDVSQTITGAVTATGANAAAASASQTVTAALTAAGVNAAAGAASQTAAAAVTAAGVNAAAGVAVAAVTAAATASAVYATSGAAAMPVVASCTAEATTSAEEEVPLISGSAGGGWYGLLDILREAADERRAERERPPAACPNDGEPLLQGPRGELYCPFDGFRPGR
ncbi:hypothetical protein [Nonomuraea angiospora]